MKLKRIILMVFCSFCLIFSLSGCTKLKNKSNGKIQIVTSTNVYANIAQNIVGKYGTSKAIITKSTTDPHDFEPSIDDAKEVAKANIVVANGLGYDSWMNNLANSSNKTTIMVGENLMHLKKGDNPHIWYDLNMPTKYVNYLVKRLSEIDKTHADYFKENAKTYLAKINSLKVEAAKIKAKNEKPVFVSEPVFDYALKAANYKIGDVGFEEAIENGTDPSPKMIDQMINAIKERKIAFFVNNVQTSSTTVNNFVSSAKQNHIPVLNVRETMPANTTYLSWMRASYQKLIDVGKHE